MDQQMNMQGGAQFSIESLLRPNFVYFIVTLAILGYLYQTRMILGREQEIKSQSANLFEKQMYLEIGFMILIGFCMYIFNNGDNTTFTWIYMLVPILYLVIKSLLVFNKVTDFIKEAPEHTDVSTDIVDLINAKKNMQQQQQGPTTLPPPPSQINNQFGVKPTQQLPGPGPGFHPPLNPQAQDQPQGFSLF